MVREAQLCEDGVEATRPQAPVPALTGALSARKAINRPRDGNPETKAM